MSGAPDRELFDAPAAIRVLHVDDDPEFADLTASFLDSSETAFDITSSTDPTDALDVFREVQFDCVVSDYDMPRLSGLELLAKIREIDPDIPFVLFTGKGSEEIASRAISSGVTDYLQKSVGTDQYTVLANRIENAVETYRSQEALAASQERLSRFVDQSPLGIIEFDESFTIVQVNDAASEILGYEPSELIGSGWTQFVPDDEEWDVASVERGLSENQGGFRNVNDVVTKEGERRRTAWYNRVVTDEDGKVITIFSQFEDVTEQTERQQALEEHNVLKSTLFEMLPVGVLAENAAGEVIRINDRLLDLLGFADDPEDIRGIDCEAFTDRAAARFADPERFRERTVQMVDGREPVWNEEHVLESGGAVERSYRPIQLPDGVGHLWVYYDVSDRRAREQQLEALNGIAQDLMAAETRESVAEIGVEAGDSVLGLETSAIHLHRPEAGLVPVAATDAARELVGPLPTFTEGNSIAWRVYETGEPVSFDDVRQEPDRYNDTTKVRSELCLPLGDYGVLLAGSPTVGTFDRSDEVLGEILATTLVTALEQVDRTEELRERERQLTRQNTRLEEFANMISHDLQTPLATAEGRLELAMVDHDSDHLREVAGAHDRMSELIDDLLTLAREYETSVDPVPVALGPFAESCWSALDVEGSRLDIRADGTVRADEIRLERMLENLFRNAMEHGSTSAGSDGRGDAGAHGSTGTQAQADDGDLTISVGELDDGFYVEDDGTGIPPEERESIFEYGYSTRPDGTGLGLAIVDQCAAVHGWTVRVTDGSEGGARFEITGVETADDQ